MPVASLAIPPGLRAIVTAGAAGIGRAIVAALLGHGARVHICDADPTALEAFRAEHKQAGVTLADVSDERDVTRLFAEARAGLGGLDLLVNNAGIAGPTGAVEAIAIADWRRCLDVDLTSQFLCTRLAVPLLKASGGGAIVNMSSAAGRFGYAWRTPYAAAKWGVIGFTQSLAKELGPSNIRVNCIVPGAVPTEINIRAGLFTEREHEDRMKAMATDHALRRVGTPQEIAEALEYLVCAEWTTGSSLVVDGGLSLGLSNF